MTNEIFWSLDAGKWLVKCNCPNKEGDEAANVKAQIIFKVDTAKVLTSKSGISYQAIPNQVAIDLPLEDAKYFIESGSAYPFVSTYHRSLLGYYSRFGML
jgi:hypothetical protein